LFCFSYFKIKIVNEKKRDADAAAKVEDVQAQLLGFKKVWIFETLKTNEQHK